MLEIIKPLRRVGLIGDPHGEAELLRVACEHLRAQGVDALLCTGDVIDGGTDVNACVSLLLEHGVFTVRGNHDRWLFSMDEMERLSLPRAAPVETVTPQTRDFLRELPPTLEFSTVAGRLLLCHGVGENDMTNLKPDDDGYALQSNSELQALLRSPYRFAVGGHTHRKMAREFVNLRDGEPFTFLNAGTLSPHRGPDCALADFEAMRVTFYELSSAPTVADVWEL